MLSSLNVSVIRSVSSRFATTSSLSFCNASSSFLPGLSFCISMLRDVSFRRTPHAPCRGLLHRSSRISMASSDVVLILFPVEWSYQSNTIWAWRFGFHTSPANAPSSLWMAICTGVTPNLSWNLFPSSCSSSMVVSSLITTTPSRERFRLSLHFAPGLFL